MNNQDMLAAISAQQDQDLEDAKRWCRGNGKDGELNAQLMPLWAFCCTEHEGEVAEVMSRFAMIGIRHVLAALAAPAPAEAAEGASSNNPTAG